MSPLEQATELYNQASKIIAAIGAGALWLLFMRRRKSSDDAQIHKDKTGSSLMDEVMKERDRAIAEADRQRGIADAAMDKMREVSERALKANLQLEGCEREQSRTQSSLLRAEAELSECRKVCRRLQRELAKLNPNHEDVQGSDFAGLDE